VTRSASVPERTEKSAQRPAYRATNRPAYCVADCVACVSARFATIFASKTLCRDILRARFGG
jgi:hypothetical protein